MTQDEIIKLAMDTDGHLNSYPGGINLQWGTLVRIVEKAIAKEKQRCVGIIETYEIPVGNSRSGELACEWTYQALYDIRDEILGVNNDS